MTPASPAAEEPPTARGARAALRNVVLELVAASRHHDRLVLELAFENTSASAYALAGEVGGEDFLLIAEGEILPPVAVSDDLRRLDGVAGIPPATRRVGSVAFTLPAGELRELRVPGFEPLTLAGIELPESGSIRPEPRPDESPDGEPPAESPLAAEIDSLLAEQAWAIERSYDFDRYLATFTAARRPQEALVFRRLRQLPLSEVRMRIERLTTGEPSPQARVELRYRLAGQPAEIPSTTPSTPPSAATAAGWSIASRTIPRGR